MNVRRAARPMTGPFCSWNIPPMFHLKVEEQRKKMEFGEETAGDGTLTLKVFSGNPSVHVTEGVIHLFRDGVIKRPEGGEPDLPDRSLRTDLVAVLGIPNHMSPSDFAIFTAPYHPNIKGMRILRGENSDHYIVVVKFDKQSHADEFYVVYNGKTFNSMEPDNATVLFVSSVEFVPIGTEVAPSAAGQIELPTCPVCLEYLDEAVSGVMTIGCSHSFHCTCLSKWKNDAACPVCRYTQQKGVAPVCAVCKTPDSLWICIICGFVGCGRYVNQHAAAHFKETGHTYSLDLETSRVWDYAGDGFVHRLVQNVDGKVMQVRPMSSMPEPADVPPPTPESLTETTKADSICLEFSYLLEAQGQHFERQRRRWELEKSSKIRHLEDESAVLLQKFEAADARACKLETEKKKLERKVIGLEKRAAELEQSSSFNQQMNDALKSNQEEWRKKIESIEKNYKDQLSQSNVRIRDLEDQVKDLMFFLEAGKKIAANEELQSGQIVVQPSASPSGPNSNSGKKGGRRKSGSNKDGV